MEINIPYIDIIEQCEKLSSFEARDKFDANGKSRYLDLHINNVDRQLIKQYIAQARGIMEERMTRMIADSKEYPYAMSFIGFKDAEEEGLTASNIETQSDGSSIYFVKNAIINTIERGQRSLNLIKNSLFPRANTEGWEVFVGTPTFYRLENSGEYYAGYTGIEGYLMQSIEVKPYTDYVLSFYYRAVDTDSSITAGVSLIGKNITIINQNNLTLVGTMSGLTVYEPAINRYELARTFISFNSGNNNNIGIALGIFNGSSSMQSVSFAFAKPQLTEGTEPIDFDSGGNVEVPQPATYKTNVFAYVYDIIASTKFIGEGLNYKDYMFEQGKRKLFTTSDGKLYTWSDDGKDIIPQDITGYQSILWNIRTDTRWNGHKAFTKHITEAIVSYAMSAWLQDKLPDRVAFYDALFNNSLNLAVKNIFTKQPPKK